MIWQRISPRIVSIPNLLIVASTAGLVAGLQSPVPTNYDEAKVGSYTLPDPLVFNNGKPVRNASDWMKRRRAEILQLFETNVYGRSPRTPGAPNYEVFDLDQNALEGRAVRKQVSIYFSSKMDGPKEDLLVYIPRAARRPVPVILSLNFSGNQAVVGDPGIKLATLWNSKTHEKQQATAESRGNARDFDV